MHEYRGHLIYFDSTRYEKDTRKRNWDTILLRNYMKKIVCLGIVSFQNIFLQIIYLAKIRTYKYNKFSLKFNIAKSLEMNCMLNVENF